jgi:3'-phosphoadenosine 5'-phosphosulfate sulfotransferase (PAPS reductase)/FAD synthetase
VKHIVSFSGGKDSTAMLLMMLEKKMPVDEIVFCDTGMEFPELYEHMDEVEKYIQRPITKLKDKRTFEYLMLEKKINARNGEEKKGHGWCGRQSRWGTTLLKTNILNRYLKKYEDYVEYIGIAFDEPARIKEKKYPLYDWKITEKQALQYCYDKGFYWGGLYEHFDRLSCWCCQNKNLKELKIIYQHYPGLWQKLKDWQELIKIRFRDDYTFPELEKRFDRQIWFEENQITMFGG